MPDRYFSAEPIHGDRAVLAGPEAHHFLHVMRGKSGDELVVFDGTGVEYTAQAARCTRSEVELAVLSREPVDRELAFPLTLAVALPKGDRQKWLVEKAVELGVTRIVPLQTARGVAQPTAGALDRLRRSVVEASKQCGRNRLLRIDQAQTLEDVIHTELVGAQRLIAHPDGAPPRSLDLHFDSAEVIGMVGPEGGFTEDEVERAKQAGWQALSLGPRILRVETAAIALAAYATLAVG
jgi:16S rRNA (uracil1498-N3)-methyltransferase